MHPMASARCRPRVSLRRLTVSCALLVFATLSVVQLACASATHNSLHLGLHASWPNTASIAEAISWLAQNTGNEQVLPFLITFLENRNSIPSNQSISESLENHLILTTAQQHLSASFVIPTLDWVLHARFYSAHVSFHQSIAEHALAAFPTVHPRPSVFALREASSPSIANFVLHLHQLPECHSCAQASAATLGPHPLLRHLDDEIFLNPTCRGAPPLILYADLQSPDIGNWLPHLLTSSNACAYLIALRFWQPENITPHPSMQGFTALTTLKSTEYGVVDDRVFETRLFTECGYGDVACERNQSSSVEYQWPDSTDEKMTFSGAQVLHYMLHMSDGDIDKALHHLRIFTDDGASLTRSPEFADIVKIGSEQQRKLAKSVQSFRRATGENDFFYINGYPFDQSWLKQGTGQILQCLSLVTAATAQLNSFSREIGYRDPIRISAQDSRWKSPNSLRVRIDFDTLAPHSLVWLNDMFKDARYKKWEALELDSEDSVSSFVQSVSKLKTNEPIEEMEHMRLVQTKSEHLSLVLVVDPGDEQQFDYLGIPESIIRADLPIHVGLVLVPNGETSRLVAAAFHYFLRVKGRKTAIQFIRMIRQVMQYLGGGFQQVPMTPHLIELAFQQVAAQVSEVYQSASAILDNDSDIRNTLEEAERFAQKLNLFQKGGQKSTADKGGDVREVSLLCLFNGIVIKNVAADVVPLALAEQDRISTLLQSNSLASAQASLSPFDQWVASDENLIVVKRISEDVKTELRHAEYKEHGEDSLTMSGPSMFAARQDAAQIQYIGVKIESTSQQRHHVTVWLVAREHAGEAFEGAKAALSELASSVFATRTKSRFAVVPEKSLISQKLLGCNLRSSCTSGPMFVINGRGIPASKLPTADDLSAEIALEYERCLTPEHLHGDLGMLYHMYSLQLSSTCSQTVGRVSGRKRPEIIEASNSAAVSNLTEALYTTHAAGTGSDPAAAISIVTLLDPTREDAYMTSSVLQSMRRAYSGEQMSIQLFLVPQAGSMKKQFEQPTVFRKYVLESQSTFHGTTLRRLSPQGSFHRLPQHRVLTISLEPPRAWFVSSYATNYDMDNVILDEIRLETTELYTEYELRNLIVEGSCIDEAENPPQGLQLVLENERGDAVDTVVMANLGYFQLRVDTPGLWNLRLAPGASRKIFSLKAMEMYKEGVRRIYKADSLGRVPIPVNSQTGAGGILLRVGRNPGMEGESVLVSTKNAEEEQSEEGIIGRVIRSTLKTMYRESDSFAHHGEATASFATKINRDTVHVFSVASGHLYERFLKIMISSVTKHSSRPVKFWLLENYLSPAFKKVLPRFARRHGASIGMVTYKWPGWLRAQTEKQRIIWAYKILFLDVLFPLDVNRIIFVDSDQVIRGDLAELMDIDLHGAPYGYVPFCDSRKDVDGYRFWKTGFWKETLGAAKYRISALYVVDLKRFRETAAGDKLRYIYQSLSADPNSLSNLDQDLPNYASVASIGEGAVPIFDLPQEWLWCESWCDDESKKVAKAIDLCNNPMTKEPKLVSAKRIISEWVDYDNAACELTEELYRHLVDESKEMDTAGQPESENRNRGNEIRGRDLSGLKEKDEL